MFSVNITHFDDLANDVWVEDTADEIYTRFGGDYNYQNVPAGAENYMAEYLPQQNMQDVQAPRAPVHCTPMPGKQLHIHR